MHKYSLKSGTMMIAALFLLCGCAATSDENLEAAECNVLPPKEMVAFTMQWDPVCGCDGKTYGNACGARGAGVPKHTPGACEENTNN